MARAERALAARHLAVFVRERGRLLTATAVLRARLAAAGDARLWIARAAQYLLPTRVRECECKHPFALQVARSIIALLYVGKAAVIRVAHPIALLAHMGDAS